MAKSKKKKSTKRDLKQKEKEELFLNAGYIRTEIGFELTGAHLVPYVTVESIAKDFIADMIFDNAKWRYEHFIRTAKIRCELSKRKGVNEVIESLVHGEISYMTFREGKL